MIEVIPVLDIMNGLIVHAYAGRREEYKPIKDSLIIDKPDPALALRVFKKMGFKTVYIADLDSIMNKGDNSKVIYEAAELGFKVLADIGRRGVNSKDTAQISFIIGTEYVEYPAEISLLSGRSISLDVFDDQVIFANTRVRVDSIVESFSKLELKKVLLIDLSRVGTGKGVNKAIVSKLVKYMPGKLIVGGGVRNEEDVLELKNLGVTGVLVATAIHKGIIRKPIY
ncbi:MAG: HisA/HisF-related TIM barrel protein [Thermosphaera sp.]